MIEKYKNKKIVPDEEYKLSRQLKIASGGDNIDNFVKMLTEIKEKGLIHQIIVKKRINGFRIMINPHNDEEMEEIIKIFEKYNVLGFIGDMEGVTH